VPAQGAADQQGQDDIAALAFQGGAVGDGQELLRLLAGKPVPQPSSLLPDVGDVGQAGRLLQSDHVVPPGLAHHLPDRREPDVDRRGGESIHARTPLHQQRPGERPADTEGEQVVERLGIVAPGVRRLDRVQDHLPQDRLGRGQGRGLLFPAFRVPTSQNQLVGQAAILPPTTDIVVGHFLSASLVILHARSHHL
jgi:hypothetical protein